MSPQDYAQSYMKGLGITPVDDLNTDLTFKDAAKTVAEFTPIIGDAIAAKEVYDELMKDEPNYGLIAALGGAALIGAVPGIGDAAAAGIRKAVDVAKRVEVDPDAVGMMGGNIRIKPKDESVWSYPEQLYDSAATSINEFRRPAGYNKLKKRGEIKDGDVIVDIGGGRFDNLVEDAAEEGATVKVYDPFNRTPEHNATVVDSVKDGQADMAMSHNVLNVIKEDENILSVVEQAENAVKPGGKAHFSVYEGSKADREKGARQTSKGWQRFQTTGEYLPFVEKVFGKDNVTLRDSIITATKNVQEFNEGGMAMEEQMAMNFGDVPDNTIGQDPVSGNDIPMGSTAENVRDDIPAMLSEGEIVIPADVVNYHGVKLFEDLRDEAKLGYAEMAEDGRIGGEPIEDDMEMENDIGLELADLEVMIIPDDEEPVEMRRGGMNFERGRGNIYKSYSAPKPTPRVVRSAPPSYKTRSVGSLKDSSPRSYTPAQLGITKIQAPTTGGPERPTLTSKPATSDTANIGNSIAQQIGMYDKDFREKTVEPKSTAERLADIRKRNQERYQGAGYVDKARDFVGGLFGFGDEQEKEGPQRVQITGDADYGFLGSPLERANRKGLGPRFDEGGMATEPFYDQKGGFGDLDYSGIQAREYMNDLGQKIIIMFQDGVPLTPIPDGYYPVAETVTPAVDSTYNVDTVNAMTGTGSYAGSVPVSAPVSSGDGGDPGGNLNMVMPTPVNYKELSLEELQDMLEDQGSLKQKGILAAASAINPIMALAIRAAMWDTSRKTKAEIERRLASSDTSNVDKMRYTNMLEIAERERPSLLDRLTGKAFEKEYSQIPSPDIPAVDFSDPTLAPDQGIAEPYTPEVTSPHVTEPMMDTVEPVTLGADPQPEVETVPLVPGTSYTLDELTQPTPAQQIQQQRDRTRDAGRSARQTFEAFRKDPSMSKSIAENPAAVQRTESVIRDMERGVQRGFEKGGMVEEPAVKEVVKGLKKASKSHAKQADQLEKALKASKKKKKSK